MLAQNFVDHTTGAKRVRELLKTESLIERIFLKKKPIDADIENDKARDDVKESNN